MDLPYFLPNFSYIENYQVKKNLKNLVAVLKRVLMLEKKMFIENKCEYGVECIWINKKLKRKTTSNYLMKIKSIFG
jgi:hypothetical protein